MLKDAIYVKPSEMQTYPQGQKADQGCRVAGQGEGMREASQRGAWKPSG